MGAKTITVKERIYELVKSHKRSDESFSDLFERTYKDKKPDYFAIVGLWGEKKGEAIRKTIEKARKESLRLSNERDKRLGLA